MGGAPYTRLEAQKKCAKRPMKNLQLSRDNGPSFPTPSKSSPGAGIQPFEGKGHEDADIGP